MVTGHSEGLAVFEKPRWAAVRCPAARERFPRSTSRWALTIGDRLVPGVEGSAGAADLALLFDEERVIGGRAMTCRQMP